MQFQLNKSTIFMLIIMIVLFPKQKSPTASNKPLKHIDYVIVILKSKENEKQIKRNKENYLYNLGINGLNLEFKVEN